MDNIMENKKVNTFAVIGFIVGLCSFVIFLWGIVPIVGIVFSGLALKKMNSKVEKGYYLAFIGLICSIMNFLMIIIAFIR